MKSIRIHRHALRLLPDSARVIIRPFIPGELSYIQSIIDRALHLSEAEVVTHLENVRREFADRHFDIDSILLANFDKVYSHLSERVPLSRDRTLLIGALFSGEYALESAALFNPSMVPHPDQSDVEEGALRFIMSLRATGEGHISSIEFRSGLVKSDGEIELCPASRFVTEPEVIADPSYEKKSFLLKLHEMGVANEILDAVLDSLGDRFTRSELDRSSEAVHEQFQDANHAKDHTLECVRWLADSNYEVRFSPRLALSERIIFPVSPNESNGLEDARFVRFVDDDGTVTYYATYTAYNGHDILPQLIETVDFAHFHVLTLNGDAVQNKGMALFPRRVGGKFAMLSRQDNENLFIMFSESPHHWSDPTMILRPSAMWEAVKLGNCGSPIETEAGWLVITHGVGPMRTYCLGAVLLDLEDPTKVIGRLPEPLLSPEGNEREGYVPNVVYSCGGLVHRGKLVLPYALSDEASAVASIELDDLLEALLRHPEEAPRTAEAVAR